MENFEGRHHELREAGCDATGAQNGGGVSLRPAATDGYFGAGPGDAMPPAHPLSGSGLPTAATMPTGPVFQQQGQQAQEVMAQAIHGAGHLVRQGATVIKVYVQANPRSITTMSFVGGCWLMLAAFLSLLNVFESLNPLHWVLQVYQLFFGLFIIAIDGPCDRLSRLLQDKIVGFTALMQSRIARVLLYVFIGCQQASQAGWLNHLTGWYFAAVAIGFAAVHCAGRPGPPGGDAPLRANAAEAH
mmetsp:Transcript_61024/g.175809  ORF Transcript_61024/g.175809 Transcript_61024/m.175809 type:complete len:244 (-) Transcript_61024:152-883(-)